MPGTASTRNIRVTQRESSSSAKGSWCFGRKIGLELIAQDAAGTGEVGNTEGVRKENAKRVQESCKVEAEQ